MLVNFIFWSLLGKTRLLLKCNSKKILFFFVLFFEFIQKKESKQEEKKNEKKDQKGEQKKVTVDKGFIFLLLFLYLVFFKDFFSLLSSLKKEYFKRKPVLFMKQHFFSFSKKSASFFDNVFVRVSLILLICGVVLLLCSLLSYCFYVWLDVNDALKK